uniref:ORF6 protein n=1 Tax=Anabaena sp. TaxID=1167 RepID=P70771_9NOST|nr:ORF6 [Nostoc sp. PCC 7120 = FACHB-418]
MRLLSILTCGCSFDPNYINAATQPSAFKFYPKFYRRVKLNLDNPIHSFIWLTSACHL